MNPVESLKVLLPISFIGTWGAVAFLVYNWRGDKSMSISRHAAAHKSAYRLMLIVQSFTLPMFLIFIFKWFVPTFHLPFIFSILQVISFTLFLIAAYIPDVEGMKGTIHSFSAYSASALFIPALIILSSSLYVATLPKAIILFSVIFHVLAIIFFASVKNLKRFHLYIQVTYFLLFDLSILSATYIR